MGGRGTDAGCAVTRSPDRDVDAIDWFGDELPGEAFASALHALRRRGEVVRVTAFGGMPQCPATLVAEMFSRYWRTNATTAPETTRF